MWFFVKEGVIDIFPSDNTVYCYLSYIQSLLITGMVDARPMSLTEELTACKEELRVTKERLRSAREIVRGSYFLTRLYISHS